MNEILVREKKNVMNQQKNVLKNTLRPTKLWAIVNWPVACAQG